MRIQNRYNMDRKNKNNLFKTIFVVFILLLMTFIISLSLNSNPFSEVLPGHDSSMFQYFGYAMDSGKTMYTEIFDHKGPMIFIINYLGVLLTTPIFQGIYVLEFLSLFIYFLFTYKTMKLWTSSFLALISIIPQGIILTEYLTGGNFTEEYALPFIAISLFIFSKYFIKSESTHYSEIIFLGMSCAIVFSLRANMVVVWLAFCLIIFLKMVISQEYNTLLKYILSFTLGLMLVFVPMSLYLYLNGALEEAIFQSIIFNITYLDGAVNQSEAVMTLYSNLANDYMIITFSLFLVYLVVSWKEIHNNKRWFYMGIVLFSIGSFLTSTLSGRAYNHYLIILVPIMTLPTALLLKQLPKSIQNNKLVIATICLIGLIYYPQIDKNSENIYVKNASTDDSINNNLTQEEQRVINISNENEQIFDIVNIIRKNSNPDDDIYTHRLGGNLYLLSERLSSIKYFNLPSVNINENPLIGEDFISDIKQNHTELIVLSSGFNNQEKTGFEKEFFEYVTNNYNLIYDQNNHHIYKFIS